MLNELNLVGVTPSPRAFSLGSSFHPSTSCRSLGGFYNYNMKGRYE